MTDPRAAGGYADVGNALIALQYNSLSVVSSMITDCQVQDHSQV